MVNQQYSVIVHDEYVMSGNTAILKCVVSVAIISRPTATAEPKTFSPMGPYTNTVKLCKRIWVRKVLRARMWFTHVPYDYIMSVVV